LVNSMLKGFVELALRGRKFVEMTGFHLTA
jgi:hypothetical protein